MSDRRHTIPDWQIQAISYTKRTTGLTQRGGVVLRQVRREGSAHRRELGAQSLALLDADIAMLAKGAPTVGLSRVH